MEYIVEVNNSNPRIMKRNDDGTYFIIGFAAGDNNLKNIVDLVNRANVGINSGLVE